MKYPNDFLERAHKFSFENRSSLMESTICGCFYCLKTYKPSEIEEWVDDKNDDTALCAYCGIDAVLPDKSELPINDKEFLAEMYRRWFG